MIRKFSDLQYMELGVTHIVTLQTDIKQIDKTLTSFIIKLRPSISLMQEDMNKATQQYPTYGWVLIEGKYFGYYYYGTKK